MTVEPLQPIEAPLYDPRTEHDACGVGFVADVDGRHASRIVPMALEALAALAHRGARAADDLTGDGSGISIPISPRFQARLLAEAGVTARLGRRPAVAMCFLPTDDVDDAKGLIEDRARALGMMIAGWREVPVDRGLVAGRSVGETPAIWQAIVAAGRRTTPLGTMRRLAMLRRVVERDAPSVAIVSISPSQVVYKGLFVGDELGRFYADLRAGDLEARYAVFHQRYSTNTFPSWRLAQPFGYLAHNGEINTIRSNREAMRGRRHALGGGRWARDLASIGPLVTEAGSDSQSLDDAVELLLMGGARIDEAIGSLVPPADGLGAGARTVTPSASEPWDGPAALAFADGHRVGALLDRNGLRPLALTATDDGLVVVSSEAGSIDLEARGISDRQRLGPGDLVVVDTRTGSWRGPTSGRTTPGQAARPLSRGIVRAVDAAASDGRLRIALGLDAEVVRQAIRPMATDGHEAIWSMGDDTPIAPLARRPRRVSAFLRQSFAQVTNPAIDPERERAVMSLEMVAGRQPLMLGPTSAPDCVALESPIIESGSALASLRETLERTVVLDATWPASRGRGGLAFALARLGRQARAAARRGAVAVVVTDRAVDRHRIAVPTLLAVGRVHQELVELGRRSRTDVIVEAGDAFDVHDVAMLLAAGASAVYPWLLLEVGAEQASERGVEDLSPDLARRNVVTALEQGLRKVLARMGISTLRSYRGGQIFDVLGLDAALVQRCFPAASHWPGSVTADALGTQLVERHRRAHGVAEPSLDDPGFVRFRGTGEAHAHAPKIVKALQRAVDDGSGLEEVRQLLADQGPRQPRDVLALRPAGPPLPIDEVEPASAIVRRFVSSAMSLGALSPEAHQAISIGMARLGASANSGEGGEDPAWYADDGGDRRDAAIKQVASARFGVTAEYLSRADQLEIKIAQGSKPGEGGQLPGRKATALIAGLRRGQPGTTMISPPPHHDIYSIEDLAQLIADLRAVNPRARIGVKLVAGAGIGTIAAGVAKAQADYIMVSGHSGGTGASPLTSIKHAGLPWELGLAETHQVLVRNRLRDRVALRTDGGLQTGRDVLVAAMLGAEEYGFGTAALVAIGCDMARQCHLDTCPTGIATQREDLRAKFTGTPEQVVAFFTAIAEDVRRELAAVGLRSIHEAIGRSELLDVAGASALDLRRLVVGPSWSPPAMDAPMDRPRWPGRPADECFEAVELDGVMSRLGDGDVVVRAEVRPRDRSIGARVSGALSLRTEPRRLAHVRYELTGSAGQSLGAFAVAGVRIELAGEANDYVGKGLSGGTIVVRPAEGDPQHHARAGNVCLFGATGGSLHVVGRAGMRFAVRNSGARAVVEGIGAHGCEYMTGGTIVVLGSVGANFGAGMTGGRAYLAADVVPEGALSESVRSRPVEASDVVPLRELLVAHAAVGSRRAAELLATEGVGVAVWHHRFVVVEPATEAMALEVSEPGSLALAR
ncbi:MAG: glutamate synthase subunit alpha [Chloroflexi bacterium]|nr:glutamate synthase subunit alpha [Chloroflexota bacterium]